MSVSREQIIQLLAQAPSEELAAVLQSAGIDADPQGEREALARRIVRALWWRTHTPAGVMTGGFDRVLNRTARRLKVTLPEGDEWERLDALTRHLLPEERLESLDEKHMDALHRANWAAWAGLSATGGVAGGGLAARKLLQWTAPVKDVLPWIPKVGPILVGARKGAQVVAKWAAPVGIGMALATVNQALGPQFDQALPLLLGIGLVKRGLDARKEAGWEDLEEALSEPEVPAEEPAEDPIVEDAPIDDAPVTQEAEPAEEISPSARSEE